MSKTLSEDLRYWRAGRPDEWTMDEFIRKAKALQADSERLLKLVDHDDLVKTAWGLINAMSEYDPDVCQGHEELCAAQVLLMEALKKATP